jgi:hypothetical protein
MKTQVKKHVMSSEAVQGPLGRPADEQHPGLGEPGQELWATLSLRWPLAKSTPGSAGRRRNLAPPVRDSEAIIKAGAEILY